jgi:UDP-N-acetylglucosamine 4,6-dehydratase/5-epimerase
MFKDATLLVTGGTGTFGNAVVDRVLSSDIREIRIFSRDEKKQDDMRRKYASAKLKFYLGDVRNSHGLRDAMHGVDFVFHAAALKQVPSCEFFPVEAIAAAVKRVIMLSTDKAVYPINAMGISKAMMEKIAVAKSRVAGENTIISITRYGNVMASRGSVVPHFLRQIQQRQPITVTDPNMTRFMMTIDGAVDLVLYAFEKGRSGDTFVQKAPAATIETLVAALKRLLGADNPVEVIGTRHGEKMHETLLTREERGAAESMGDYYRVPCDTRDLNYNLYYSEGDERVSHVDDYNSANTRQLDVDAMSALLQQLECVRQALRGERVDA